MKALEKKVMIGGTADEEKKKKIKEMRAKLKKKMIEHELIE